jgi:hypothetical protein
MRRLHIDQLGKAMARHRRKVDVEIAPSGPTSSVS